jgi:glutaredoxin
MQRDVIHLPAGTVATTQPLAAHLNLVSRYVEPGDGIFQAAWPGVYLPLHARNPVAFETVNVSDMPRPGDAELVVQQLGERQVPYVLWAARLDEACAPGCSDRLSPLREYVHAMYAPVATLPDGDTLWRRRQ